MAVRYLHARQPANPAFVRIARGNCVFGGVPPLPRIERNLRTFLGFFKKPQVWPKGDPVPDGETKDFIQEAQSEIQAEQIK